LNLKYCTPHFFNQHTPALLVQLRSHSHSLHGKKKNKRMLSSTDDDASWSNLGTEEIVEDEQRHHNSSLKEEAQMTCDDNEQEPSEEKEELEDLEDAWEGKDEEVRKWLELAEAQFDARKSPLLVQKKSASYATTAKYDTPRYEGEKGVLGLVRENDPRDPVVAVVTAGAVTTTAEHPRRGKRKKAMKKLTRSLDVKVLMSLLVSICVVGVGLYVAVLEITWYSNTRDVVVTNFAPSHSEKTNSFEERLKAIEEIQRCEIKLEKAKEKVEELVTKILEQKRKLLTAKQRGGVFASFWSAFDDDEYPTASHWTAMVAVVTYFTGVSMVSLWFWKLVNFAFFGNGEMEESSFLTTTTTTTTASGKSISAKESNDDEKGGHLEKAIDSYAKVARHLNGNKTPTSSLRGALRTPSDLAGVPKPFATSSLRRRSVSPTISSGQRREDGATPLQRLPRYKTPPLPPTTTSRKPAREDSVNNLGRRMQDVADEDLAMNLFGEQ